MKKMILLFAVLLTISLQNYLRAQTDADVVNFTVILNDLFDIEVQSGDAQIATFNTSLEYNGGVWEGAGINNGISVVTMETTGDWNCVVSAPDFGPANPLMIPIENLGVWIEATGDHQDGVEVEFTCTDIASTQLITNVDAMLIDLGTDPAGNAGDMSDNEFTLHWRMGTPEVVLANGLGTMFDQMSNGDFGPGTYTSIVTFTLTAIP